MRHTAVVRWHDAGFETHPWRDGVADGAGRTELPASVRWVATAWVAVWLAAYGSAFPLTNFLNLCDIAMILTWIGLVSGSRLVLSSQALSSTVVGALWVVDVTGRLVLGRHLVGGTEYMFNVHEPLFLRVLSAFHAALPMVQLWAVRRLGYDRRGLSLQAAIAATAMLAGRLVGPESNINFSFRNPFSQTALGPAPLHLAVTIAGLVLIAYVPTHFALARLFPRTASWPIDQEAA